MSFDEQKVDRQLKGGAVLGFNLMGDVPAFGLSIAPQDFGYITIRWHYVSPMPPYDYRTEPEQHQQWLVRKAKWELTPYHVTVAVVREKLKERESRLDEDYPEADDYLADAYYEVGSVAEVESIVNLYGKSLADAKPLRELRMP